MKVVGLTGGIASGKSTVLRMFAERGAQILSADEDARAVLANDSPTLAEVLAAFPTVRRPDGTLDRPALAALIFADPAARQRLEAIMHPAIFARMEAAIETARQLAVGSRQSGPPHPLTPSPADGRGGRDANPSPVPPLPSAGEGVRGWGPDCRLPTANCLIYEVPLLYEKNREGMFDAVIAVYAPTEVQAVRLQERERAAGRLPLTEGQIAERFAAQLPGEEKARRANFVIRTDVPIGDTEAEVERIYRQLTESEAAV